MPRFIALLLGCLAAGCGTTRISDTTRTATEQLLLSDAIDRAVESLDVQTLTGQSVYLDDSKIGSAIVDREYLVSSIRQHMLASGCILKATREEADFVVEARAGALGTDRNDLLFGIPATNVPQVVPLAGVPAAIPEIPFAKRSIQRAVAKLAVFAYHRETGEPVWQSGLAMSESSSQGFWVLGAGPFHKGSIYNGTKLPGQGIKSQTEDDHRTGRYTRIADTAVFTSPHSLVKTETAGDADVATSESVGPMNEAKPAAYADVTPAEVVNQAYAELPIEPEPKRPGPPPEPDQKVRAIPSPPNSSPGAAGE